MVRVSGAASGPGPEGAAWVGGAVWVGDAVSVPGRRGLGPVVGRVLGEVHEGLFQRDRLWREFVERYAVRGGDRADVGCLRATDA